MDYLVTWIKTKEKPINTYFPFSYDFIIRDLLEMVSMLGCRSHLHLSQAIHELDRQNKL